MIKLSAKLVALAVVILATPIGVYLWKFGFELSADHTRWSEFGSAMSGIYSPVLTLVTLAVLLMQVGLQKQMHSHGVDLAFIQQSRADVEFYVQRLAEALTIQLHYGNQAGEILRVHFQPPAVSDLDSELLRELAKEIESASPRIYALLAAIQSILAGLSATNEPQFKLNYTAALQKLIAMLGFETCVALEHFDRVRNQGLPISNYHFSPLLAPRSAP